MMISFILLLLLLVTWPGKGDPNIRESAFNIECTENQISIAVAKKEVKHVEDNSDLYLLDKSCFATSNRTHFVLKTEFDKCGTVIANQRKMVIRSNMLTLNMKKGTARHGCPMINVVFSCAYSKTYPRNIEITEKSLRCQQAVASGPIIKKGIVSKAKPSVAFRTKGMSILTTCVGLTASSTTLKLEEKTVMATILSRRKLIKCRHIQKSGKHDLKISLFADREYSVPITSQYYANTATVDLFYEIELPLDDKELEISLTTCYVTPSRDSTNKMAYFVIKDRCIVDSTVQFYKSEPKKIRFSVRSFNFVGKSKSQLFMHCKVDICEINDVNSKCHQGCKTNYRNKRKLPSHMVDPRRKLINVQEVSTVCHNKMMKITVKVDRHYHKFNKRIYLKDQGCKAVDNGTHLLLNHRIGDCGDIYSRKKSEVVVKNRIFFNMRNAHQSGFSMDVNCTLRSTGSVGLSSARFRVTRPRQFLIIRNMFPYRFSFKVKMSRKIKQRFIRVPTDVRIKRYKGIFHISTETQGYGLQSHIWNCALRYLRKGNKREHLMEKGCPVNKRVLFYYQYRNEEIMRVFTNPSMAAGGELGYISCSIHICNRDDPNCSSNCKRSPASIPGERSQVRIRRDIDPKDVNVFCNKHSMTVILRKDKYPRTEAVDLRLRDPSCRALDNETHFIMSTRLSECGTTVVTNGDTILYGNEIKETVPGALIVRRTLIDLPFRCLYRAEQLASSAIFRLKSPTIFFGGVSEGVYDVKLKMYTDSSFLDALNGVLALVDPRKDMYFEVSLTVPDPKMVIVLDQCYGKPTGSSNEREKYVFIRDGCPVDDTVRLYKRPRDDVARFSVKPFEFSVKPVKTIFVNCAVSACSRFTPKVNCYKRC